MTFEQLIDRDKILELMEQGTGKGVKVGILDSGVDFTHPAFQAPCIDLSRCGNFRVILRRWRRPELTFWVTAPCARV